MKLSAIQSVKTKFIYTFQAFQKDHFWLPGAIMALFMIIAVFIQDSQKFNIFRAFIGFTLPLITGGLSAYAILEDHALELRFTTSHSTWKMIFERMMIIWIVITFTALVFQSYAPLIGVGLESLGNIFLRQLTWVAPCLAMLAMGSAASLLMRSSPGGFALIGGIWMMQLFLRGWFARNAVLRNILLFYGAMDPNTKAATVNQVSLILVSILLLFLTNILLKKYERYI